jgi:hypothetical protein
MAARARTKALAAGLAAGLTTVLLAGCGIVPDWGGGAPEPEATAGGGGGAAEARPPETAVTLVGLDPGAVHDLLGTPLRSRRDSPAEVWQYLSEACVVDLFLYEEAGGYRVTFYEARTIAGEDTQPAPCLAALRSRRLNAG